MKVELMHCCNWIVQVHAHNRISYPRLLPPVNEVWGKVIFSQASVCPQRGARGLPDIDPLHRDSPPWTENPPGQRLTQTETPWIETFLDRDPWIETPWTETPWVKNPAGQRHSPRMVKSGRYASHWNAFLCSHCGKRCKISRLFPTTCLLDQM